MTGLVAPPDIVLLAAGRGSRLGGTTPKPLTPLGADGETLIARQLRLLGPLRERGSRVTVVVGHREQEFRDCLDGVHFVRSPRYAETNTAVSLLVGLAPADRGALWLNTDVAFSTGFADALVYALLAGAGSFVAVRRGRTADEEVKYLLDEDGAVCALSKQVQRGLGEAIGVNHVSPADREVLRRALAARGDGDYFEAAVEATIGSGTRWSPLDLTDHFAVEVDFPEDLAIARAFVAGETSSSPVALAV